MVATLMKAEKVKQAKFAQFAQIISDLKIKKIIPHLVVVQVGDDLASNIYIKHKAKACANLNIKFTNLKLPDDITFEDLKKTLYKLNNDPKVNAIIIQFPLPKHLASKPITLLIDPIKDGDGLHPLNQGLQLLNTNIYSPIACTPKGIIALLETYQISLTSKNVVIVGRSNIVGKPLISLLLQNNATVSVVHTKTISLAFKNLLKNADIIISATGNPDLIKPSDVKKGVVIIDVGIIRDANNNLRGDIDYKKFLKKAAFITPVPGGVGPMTVTMLIENTLELTQKQVKEQYDRTL